MYGGTVVICGFNLLMPVIVAAIIAPRLKDTSSWRLGFFGGVICSVTSIVFYLNIGIIEYPEWAMSAVNIVIVFLIAFVLGFIMGMVAMRVVKDQMASMASANE